MKFEIPEGIDRRSQTDVYDAMVAHFDQDYRHQLLFHDFVLGSTLRDMREWAKSNCTGRYAIHPTCSTKEFWFFLNSAFFDDEAEAALFRLTFL